ncbi:MAG: GNAT family N-acetyltransferase [Bacilli bacterium]|jgi:predicted acetyltransferase|nr:GNAT family N-acetyltransferase [Bacilli bacterium]
MNCELSELNLEMGRKEYEMYQDIPSKESGSTNLCKGLPYEVFHNYLESQLARKYQNISEYDTPTTIYIFYVNRIPVGYIGLRTSIDDKWKKWSGNIFYVIRQSERGKGYASKMLEIALEKLEELKIDTVFCQSSAGNIASSKVIEKNGGVLLEEIDGTRYYEFNKENKK